MGTLVLFITQGWGFSEMLPVTMLKNPWHVISCAWLSSFPWDHSALLDPLDLKEETASFSAQGEEWIQRRYTHHSDTFFQKRGPGSCTWKCPHWQGSPHHVHRGWAGMDLRHMGRKQCLQWTGGEKPPTYSSNFSLLPKWESKYISSDWGKGETHIAFKEQGKWQSHDQREGFGLETGQERRNSSYLPSAWILMGPFSLRNSSFPSSGFFSSQSRWECMGSVSDAECISQAWRPPLLPVPRGGGQAWRKKTHP